MGESSPTVQDEDVPQLVFSTLIDEFGESQEEKYKGFVATQSLTGLMDYLDPHDVVRVYAAAESRDQDESFKGGGVPGDARHCVKTVEKLISTVELRYDRGKHGQFPWEDIQEFFDLETSSIDDLAVRRATIRLSSEQLEEHLRDVLCESINLGDRKYLKSPFFFKMGSRNVESQKERDLVEKWNEEEFLKNKGHRVLELAEMYSLRAMQDKPDPVLGMSPKEVEDMAFNHSDEQTHSFGALYSNLVINKWRQAFSRSIGEKTRFMWSENGQWERADELEAELN